MGMLHLNWQMRNIFQVKEEILTKGNNQCHGARAALLELKIFRNLGYQGGWNSSQEQVSAEMGITGVEENPSLETLKTQLGEVLGNLGSLNKHREILSSLRCSVIATQSSPGQPGGPRGEGRSLIIEL